VQREAFDCLRRRGRSQTAGPGVGSTEHEAELNWKQHQSSASPGSDGSGSSHSIHRFDAVAETSLRRDSRKHSRDRSKQSRDPKVTVTVINGPKGFTPPGRSRFCVPVTMELDTTVRYVTCWKENGLENTMHVMKGQNDICILRNVPMCWILTRYWNTSV